MFSGFSRCSRVSLPFPRLLYVLSGFSACSRVSVRVFLRFSSSCRVSLCLFSLFSACFCVSSPIVFFCVTTKNNLKTPPAPNHPPLMGGGLGNSGSPGGGEAQQTQLRYLVSAPPEGGGHLALNFIRFSRCPFCRTEIQTHFYDQETQLFIKRASSFAKI